MHFRIQVNEVQLSYTVITKQLHCTSIYMVYNYYLLWLKAEMVISLSLMFHTEMCYRIPYFEGYL